MSIRRYALIPVLFLPTCGEETAEKCSTRDIQCDFGQAPILIANAEGSCDGEGKYNPSSNEAAVGGSCKEKEGCFFACIVTVDIAEDHCAPRCYKSFSKDGIECESCDDRSDTEQDSKDDANHDPTDTAEECAGRDVVCPFGQAPVLEANASGTCASDGNYSPGADEAAVGGFCEGDGSCRFACIVTVDLAQNICSPRCYKSISLDGVECEACDSGSNGEMSTRGGAANDAGEGGMGGAVNNTGGWTTGGTGTRPTGSAASGGSAGAAVLGGSAGEGQVCTPGLRDCDDNVPRECDGFGNWQEEGACPGECMAEGQCESTWQIVGNAGFSPGGALYTWLAFSASTPYVAFRDAANGGRASVLTFDGTSWVNVGAAGFSAGEISDMSVVFSGTIPYVAYQDWGNSNRATVMYFNGTSWVPLGRPGFSPGTAGSVSLAFSEDIPYVAFRDGLSDFRVTVMRFENAAWEYVGSPGVSTGAASYTSLAIYDSSPYVAFQDGDNSQRATVMRFNGSIWTLVGTPGFSETTVDFMSLGFLGSTSYVAFRDGGGGITTMTFNGNWVNVGAPGFSDGMANYTRLAFSESTAHVVFQDLEHGGRATVMKLEGESWASVGAPGFTPGPAEYASLAFQGTTPYVVFQDGSQTDYRATVMKFE